MRVRVLPKLLLSATLILLLGGAIYFSLTQTKRTNGQAKRWDASEWRGNDFEAVTIAGERFSLSRLVDKPVVVHFWASWCGPCVNEFPSMIRFIESFRGEIHLVAISADQSDEDIRAFLKRTGVVEAPFIHLIRDEGGKLAEQFLAKMLPTSVILGRGLKVVKRLPGEVEWADAELRRIFGKLIEDQPAQ